MNDVIEWKLECEKDLFEKEEKFSIRGKRKKKKKEGKKGGRKKGINKK